MPHILSFCHALKFSWVKKLLDPLNHTGWKSLFLDKVENLRGDNFWMFSKPALNKLQNRLTKFWKNGFEVYLKRVLRTSRNCRLPNSPLCRETRISNQHDLMDPEAFSPKKTLEHDKMTEYEAFLYLLD